MSRNPKALIFRRVSDDAASAVRHSFVGRLAQLPGAAPISQAEAALAAGEGGERVRQQTGWFRGVDGRMRFEISDDHSRPTEMLIDSGVRAAYWVALYDRKKRSIDAAKRKALKRLHAANDEIDRVRFETGEPFESRGPMSEPLAVAHEKKDAALAVHRSLMGVHPQVDIKLSDLLQHDELYKAYPQLRDLNVKFWEGIAANGGAYSELTKSIELSPKSTPEQNHSVLLHEAQHAIQHMEGFASGGSPTGMVRYVIDKSRGPLEREFGHLHSYLMAKEEGRIAEWVLNTIAATGEGISPLEAYRRLSGEVEARNVERRRAMTRSERLAMPPKLTSDVPLAQQIVLDVNSAGDARGFGQMSAPSHPSAMAVDSCVHLEVLEDIYDTLSAYPCAPPGGMDGVQIREFLRNRRSECAALFERLVQHADGILLPSAWGGFQAVSPDVRPDGQAWRVTAFDAEMVPVGHDPFDEAKDAVAIVVGSVDMTRLLLQIEHLKAKPEFAERLGPER